MPLPMPAKFEDSRKTVANLLVAASALLLCLLGFIVLQVATTFRDAELREEAAALGERSLYVYGVQARSDGDVRPSLDAMRTTRDRLRRPFPTEVARLDPVFDAFATRLEREGRIDWENADSLRQAAQTLSRALYQDYRQKLDLLLSVSIFTIVWFVFTLYLGGLVLARYRNSQERLLRENADQERQQERFRKESAEREAAAHRFVSLFAGIPVACYSFDPRGRILIWNHAAEVVFDRTAAQVVGRPIREVIGTADDEEDVLRRIAQGEETVNREWTFRGSDGTIKSLLTTTFPLRDGAERITGGVSATVDITARKQAEERLQTIVEDARCIVWDAEVTQEPETGRLRWKAHLRNERSAFLVLPLDTTDRDYIAAWVESRADDQARLHATSTEAILSGKPGYTQEFRCRDRYGNTVWLSEHVRIRALEPGRWQVTGISTDITDRKRFEERLDEVLAGARCLLWEADVRRNGENLDWDMRILNQETARQLFPLDTTVDKYEWAWDKSRLKEDRVRIDRTAEEALRGNLPGYRQEFRCRDLHGNLWWFYEDALIKPLGADHWTVIGVCREVTSGKLAEERLESVLNKARCILWDAIVTLDGEELVWDFEICNEASALRIVPLDTAPKQYSRAWSDSRLPEDMAKIDGNSREAILWGKPGYTQEFRCRDRDGVDHWLREEAQIQPLGPDKWRVIGVCTDITEQKAAEVRLRNMANELARSNAALQDFASIASHDLKEPLRKIRTFGSMLARKASTLDGDAAGYLERMLSASDRMQALIDGLLSYSRVTTKGNAFAPTDLNAVVREVLNDLEVRIAESRATIRVAPLPTIDADALQMRQLFQNLIGNALKFHRDGLPTVICIEHEWANGRHILTIEDNGMGFSEKDAERIFDVFERLDGNHREGTGIGLAICRKIVERHGGTIRATGIPDIGAKFVITFG
ncbi:MAG: PAS domain S-box protein [Capsulimonadales bacterium]|nr:PAS domain S-box protein [Capsulimonadales bacterium]